MNFPRSGVRLLRQYPALLIKISFVYLTVPTTAFYEGLLFSYTEQYSHCVYKYERSIVLPTGGGIQLPGVSGGLLQLNFANSFQYFRSRQVARTQLQRVSLLSPETFHSLGRKGQKFLTGRASELQNEMNMSQVGQQHLLLFLKSRELQFR